MSEEKGGREDGENSTSIDGLSETLSATIENEGSQSVYCESESENLPESENETEAYYKTLMNTTADKNSEFFSDHMLTNLPLVVSDFL